MTESKAKPAIFEPGRTTLKHLFEPVRIGRFEVANRVKYGACCVSNYNTRDGYLTPRELARTKVIAETGCGMITNQGAYPDESGEGKGYFRQLALYDEKFLPGFETIAGYFHDAGAVAIQQILHAGRYGGIDIGYCVQPSVVPQTLPHFRPPREMTKDEIRQTIRDHASCAKLSIRAGFDGVELTSFMGYLLANFNSPFTNKRGDEYGGSVVNRGRFMRELVTEVKLAIGDDNLLIVRLNGAELMDRWGGSDEDECFELMQQAAGCGVDMISVTVGWQEAPESSIGRDVAPGHWNRLAARAKALMPDMPIAFGVRLPDPVMADKCIEGGEFDYWEVCRPLLADPELVHKAAENRLDERKRCVGSLNCLSRMFRDLPYWCTVNPALGHEVEPEYHVTPAAVEKRVMIVGAGPAGMECAIAASRRGHRVTVYDRAGAIGGNLLGYARNDLAHPEDLMSLVEYYEKMAGKHAIEVCLGTEIDSRFMRGALHEFDVVVCAAGAAFDLGALPNEAADGFVLNAHDVALGKHRPTGRVVVLGGGKVGLTLAEFLASNGCTVTVLESARRIGGDVAPTWKWRHIAWLEELKVEIITGCTVKGIADGAVDIVTADGDEATVAADAVIAASGERPDQSLFRQLEWMVDELHGCGDALVNRGLGQAIHGGYRLGCSL